MNRTRFQTLCLYGFVLPALGLYALFVLYPFTRTIWLSLHKWDGANPAVWVGANNFYQPDTPDAGLNLAHDGNFHRALGNNVRYWLMTLLSEVVAGLALAALLSRVKRGAAFYRLAFSTPLMIAMVASAVLWRQILHDKGLLNSMLDMVGLAGLKHNWISPDFVVYAISIISGWAYAGFYMLIFNAAIERIPKELREAAEIDGASGLSLFFRIELPLLRPVLAVCVLLCSTGAFRAFDLFYVILGTAKSATSEVAATWLVKNAFTFKFFGYASAIAVIVVVVVMTLAAVLNFWASRERELEY